MKCKPYSEITVEIRTQLKTVKIASNIFAVQCRPNIDHLSIKVEKGSYFVHYLKTDQT